MTDRRMGEGAHWLTERATAVALVPLTLWFIEHIIRLAGKPHQAMLEWTSSPFTTAMLLCLVLATFHHMQTGLKAVIDDYVHDQAVRQLSLLALRGVTILLTLTSVLSVMRLWLV